MFQKIFKLIKDFLAEMKKFSKRDDKSMNVVELKQVKQDSQTMIRIVNIRLGFILFYFTFDSKIDDIIQYSNNILALQKCIDLRIGQLQYKHRPYSVVYKINQHILGLYQVFLCYSI